MVCNKLLAAFFFTPLGQGGFRCNLCGQDRRQAPNPGYSNLLSHLAGQHEGYETQYASFQSNSNRPLQSFGFVPEEASHMFQWIQWLVVHNMPVHKVEDELTRAMSKLRPVTVKAIKKCMEGIAIKIGKKLEKELGVFFGIHNMPVHKVEDELTRAMSKLRPVTVKAIKKCMEGIAIKIGKKLEKELGVFFGIMFYGWSHAGVHYVAVYAVYEADGDIRVPLLGLSRLAEGVQTADAHVQLFENILDVYNKTNDMVAFLVGDNCATNQSMATKMGVPLVGCASHRFNLAVNKYLAPYEDLLSSVNDLMVDLRKENNLAKLKKYTHLNPVKRNVTRWSSTFTMVQRYIRIRGDIKKVDAVEDLIPTGAQHRKLVALFEHLKKFDSVCKRLQRDSTDMAEVRVMFDALIAEYPVMGEHLRTTAKIVHTPAFETGVAKVIAGSSLTSAEEAELKRFEITQTTGKKSKEREEDYASLLLQGTGKRKRTTRSTEYMPLVKLIPPTSNTVERLFSQCKLVLTPQRRSMLPANFEQLAFLRVNRDLWNVSTVVRVCSEETL